MAIGFIVLYTLDYGFLPTPMIADCAANELYQSGNYAPALMGTVVLDRQLGGYEDLSSG